MLPRKARGFTTLANLTFDDVARFNKKGIDDAITTVAAITRNGSRANHSGSASTRTWRQLAVVRIGKVWKVVFGKPIAMTISDAPPFATLPATSTWADCTTSAAARAAGFSTFST